MICISCPLASEYTSDKAGWWDGESISILRKGVNPEKAVENNRGSSLFVRLVGSGRGFELRHDDFDLHMSS